MLMDSKMESEQQLEGSLEEFPHEDDAQESLEDKEAYETIDLSSSVELTYTISNNSYLPLLLPSLYYILYKLEPKMKFLYQAHRVKPSHISLTCQILLYHVKLEDIHNQDPYVVMLWAEATL